MNDRMISSKGLMRLTKTAMRFGAVGLTTVGIYFIALALLRPVIANVAFLSAAAYVVSAVFNYALQARVTFGARFADGGAVLRYLAMHAGLMVLNSALMWGLVTGLGLWLYGAQLIVTGIVAATSFGLSYLWVYQRDPEA